MYFIFLLVLTLFATPEKKEFKTVSGKISGYNLRSPYKSWILSDALNEISGIVAIDSSTVACVQDEKGIVFIYDLKNQKINRKIQFHDDGDYEDLTFVNKVMYVLRSDGTLFALTSFTPDKAKSNAIKTHVPSENNEGLCYDPVTKKLLIACKGDIKKDKYEKKRAIYTFDLKTQTLDSKPFLVIDPKDIKNCIKENKLHFQNKKDDDFDIDFRMAAIGIHPFSKKIFVVCASDYIICVFNRDGKVENIEMLDSKLFNKTEGLAFLPNGDLIFSNEGENGKPSLLRFKYISK